MATNPTVKKIGVLRGRETTFPDGLVHHINQHYGEQGIQAEFLEIDAVRMDGDPGYAVILDRISHEVPFYRSYVKWAALKGTYIVNNPFWWSADDKFIDNIIAEAAGVAVPKSLILPHKNRPPNTEAETFRNLKFPLDWDAIAAYIGFPAFLKPHDGGGRRDVTKVHSPDELLAAYDGSGAACMMLQEGIAFEAYFRCYGIGRQHVHIMRYNPLADTARARYIENNHAPLSDALRERLERDVLALCRAQGYDMNAVEFAVRDGVPYAIDFMNPAPDADYWTIGQENYEWVIHTMADFLATLIHEPPPKQPFTAHGAPERA